MSHKKEELPLWSLCSFKGHVRNTNSLVSVNGIMLDIDDAEYNGDMIPYCSIAYTTYNHTETSPHWRVMLPLTRTITIQEYEEVLQCLMKYVSCDPLPAVQGFFVPCKTDEYLYDINLNNKILNPDERSN